MRNCYCAPYGALFMSEGKRIAPLNYFTAEKLFDEVKEYRDLYSDDEALHSMASDIAGDICTIGCDKCIDLFMAFASDEEYDECYEILARMYVSIDEDVPLEIRAVATVPDLWAELIAMTADEVEVLLEYFEERDSEDD